MIYFSNTTEAQTFYVPVSIADTGGDGTYTFTLFSTVARRTVVTASVEELADYATYRTFSIELPEDALPGEYEYTLTSGDLILSTGVASIAGGVEEVTENEMTIEYEQYRNE